MPEYFFLGYILSEIFAIIFWSIGHTRENFVCEAFWKLFSWFMSIFFTLGNIWSLVYQIPKLVEEPFITEWFLLIISYCLTLPMYFYLENILPQKTERTLHLCYSYRHFTLLLRVNKIHSERVFIGFFQKLTYSQYFGNHIELQEEIKD